MRKLLITCILLLIYSSSVQAASVTPEDLIGDYALESFTISNSYGSYPSSTFSSFSGRASATMKGLVMDMTGYSLTLGSLNYYSCGFYSLWSYSDRMTVSVKGGSSNTVDFSLSGETLTTSWSEYIDGVYTNLSCVWRRTQNYYTTQTTPAGKTKVVVVPLF